MNTLLKEIYSNNTEYDVTEFDYILEAMKYSYSSANTYDNCKHCFKLTYIDYEDRTNNFFANFGTMIHLCLEKYFKNELDLFDLPSFYRENYSKYITESCPPYPAGMADMYFQDGLNFLENFDFNKDEYEILFIEEALESEYEGTKVTAKPDLVLKEKATGKHYLIDYKTSKLKLNKYDDKKIAGYLHQMNMYAYYLWMVKGIKIDKIKLWFIRNNIVKEFDCDPMKIQETMEWFGDTIKKIKSEENWDYNNKEKYFCQQICSMRLKCPHKP